MKRFDLQTQARISIGQILPITRGAFGLGLGQVASPEFKLETVTPLIFVSIKRYGEWSTITLRIDDSVSFDEQRIAKAFSLTLSRDVIIDLPENEWACGFWLQVKPDGKTYIVFIDDDMSIDPSQTEPFPAPIKDSHCSYCGTEYSAHFCGDKASWPKHCNNCQRDTWRNPLPVTVVLCKVIGDVDSIVLVRRSIEPHIGEWALPGGYLDVGETWQQGAARELFEETGIKVLPNSIILTELITAPSNSNLLIFCEVLIAKNEVPNFIPNNEVSELMVTRMPIDLAFPTHTEMLTKFFRR